MTCFQLCRKSVGQSRRTGRTGPASALLTFIRDINVCVSLDCLSLRRLRAGGLTGETVVESKIPEWMAQSGVFMC